MKKITERTRLDYDKYRDKLKDIFARNLDRCIEDEALEEFHNFLRDNWHTDNLKLYRYSSAEYYNIRNFETGKLKLTNAGVLNDVYEGIPAEEYGELDESILHELQDIACMKCFSEKANDMLMWSHYADEHKGFCVEYDVSEIEHNSPLLTHLYPVVYSEKREYTTQTSSVVRELKELRVAIKERYMHDYEGYLQDIMGLFLQKGKQWSEEREWRIVYTLLQIYEENKEELYNHIIPFDYATGIYLGYRIEKEKKQNLIEIVKRINEKRIEKNRTSIKVFEVHLKPDSYELCSVQVQVK